MGLFRPVLLHKDHVVRMRVDVGDVLRDGVDVPQGLLDHHLLDLQVQLQDSVQHFGSIALCLF